MFLQHPAFTISFRPQMSVDLERDMVMCVQNGGLFVHDLTLPQPVFPAGNALYQGAPQQTKLHKAAAVTLRPRRRTGKGDNGRRGVCKNIVNGYGEQ